MTTKRENMPYQSLPGTVLIGVSVSRCVHCGEYEVAIPAIDGLNHALAQTVIRKRTRLAGDEIRFLRTYLGYSGADFARLIGSDPASVSRWESGKQPIGHHTDLLLRAMVAIDKKVTAYPIATFAEVGAEKAEVARYAFKATSNKWREQPAVAA